jgi:hypothetical protein
MPKEKQTTSISSTRPFNPFNFGKHLDKQRGAASPPLLSVDGHEVMTELHPQFRSFLRTLGRWSARRALRNANLSSNDQH